MRRLRWQSICAFCLLAGLHAAAVRADARESYRKGVEAIAAEDWAAAVRWLREAVAERPQARTSFRRYTPYYFLGVAYGQQGECRSALEAFATSETQGQIQKTREYADLRQRKKACEAELEQELARRLNAAEAAVETAAAAGEALQQLATQPDLAERWTSGEPSLASRERQASELLARARQTLTSARSESSGSLADEATALAERARAAFEETIAAGRGEIADVRQSRRESAQSRLGEMESGALEVLRSVSDLAPYPRNLRAKVGEVESVLDQIEQARDASARPAELDALHAELDRVVKGLERAARRPHSLLRAAVGSFLEGDYGTVLETLENHPFTSRRSLAHICLLRTASRFALYVMEGEEDSDGLTTLRQEIGECATARGALEPRPELFSPRYIQLYEAARDAAVQEASQ